MDDCPNPSNGAWADRDQPSRSEVEIEELGQPIRRNATSDERGGDLEVEDCRDDDLVLPREQRGAAADGGAVPRFIIAERGHGHGCIQHVGHRRPWSRSATADVPGSAALNSRMNRFTLRAAAAGSMADRERGFGGIATSTGTIAAAGLP